MPFYGENFSADARSERKKRYFHELEALLSERNTDYRDAEDYAQHKIERAASQPKNMSQRILAIG